ncbi:hypothetical protein MD588_18950 [Photobacterium sp. SDRW27]|uniref:hypothetical protein n=1 Tax=Photobacterium obscurum TaxID=2829490 RepID=UPI002243EB17|nr:hypothetical protein [Photobacterium obscurum]MCW8330875.1 hypothetical protein [Photobacterium obscurum]
MAKGGSRAVARPSRSPRIGKGGRARRSIKPKKSQSNNLRMGIGGFERDQINRKAKRIKKPISTHTGRMHQRSELGELSKTSLSKKRRFGVRPVRR